MYGGCPHRTVQYQSPDKFPSDIATLIATPRQANSRFLTECYHLMAAVLTARRPKTARGWVRRPRKGIKVTMWQFHDSLLEKQ